jgi:hypothetical protein
VSIRIDGELHEADATVVEIVHELRQRLDASRAEAERLREALELLPSRLAEMLLASYRVLAHDGRGLKGEHYWMEHAELAEIFKREQGRLAALAAEKPAETKEGTGNGG